jgi:hypothetical protein
MSPRLNMVTRPLGRVPHYSIASSLALSTETAFQLPVRLEVLTIGLWEQVTVVFAESVGASDRDWWEQVTVDKSAYPKVLLTVAQLPRPVGSWPVLPSGARSRW